MSKQKSEKNQGQKGKLSYKKDSAIGNSKAQQDILKRSMELTPRPTKGGDKKENNE